MKRFALLALGVLSFGIGAYAQAPAADDPAIATPLLALPANLREGAGVVKWNQADHTYTTLKKSTNNMVCYDRSGFPLQNPFSMECTDMRNLDRAKQNMEAEALGDKAKSEAKLNEEEKAGTRVKPVYGSVWYHLMGASKEQARTHMTIAVPGATQATVGLPENGRAGGVWIMNAGTTTAHLMTPGE
jgi:hypothetical protein